MGSRYGWFASKMHSRLVCCVFLAEPCMHTQEGEEGAEEEETHGDDVSDNDSLERAINQVIMHPLALVSAHIAR